VPAEHDQRAHCPLSMPKRRAVPNANLEQPAPRLIVTEDAYLVGGRGAAIGVYAAERASRDHGHALRERPNHGEASMRKSWRRVIMAAALPVLAAVAADPAPAREAVGTPARA
jgi:hypothetical protein